MEALRLHSLVVAVFLTTPGVFSSQPNVVEAEQSATPYVVTNGEIVSPLTSTTGNPTRGEQIVLDRERGDCVVCHLMPLPNPQFHGTIGPSLVGVGARYPSGALRLRVVDPKMMNPQSVMPAYHKISGLHAVSRRLRGKPILNAQEVEDVVAYLLTLKTELPLTGQTEGTNASPMTAPRPQTPYSVAGRQSGYLYLSTETQELQNDEFANPGMLWVERGRDLWREVEGGKEKSCTSCHAEAEDSMRGVRLRFPRVDPRRKKLINLEQQINRCREEHMRAQPYAYESDALLSLTTLIAYQSRGLPLEAQRDQDSEPFFIAGQQSFMQRRGQLDLACTHCHDQLAGQRLRGEVISQGQVNGFPIYRQLWQTLGSSHRMFSWCNTAIRAEPFPLGSDEYVNLELYMAWRARGLAIETPAVRR